MPLLQYPVHFELFRDHGRLNPHDVPLEDAGDCGANTLFLLGVIDRGDAIELSRKQNVCWINKRYIEFKPSYLFKKYLFTDTSKQYEVIECNKEELMIEVQELNPGYGTFLYMEDADTHLGHYTCIYKNIYGHIEIADLQREELIEHHVYDPDRLDDYLSQYDLFYIPSTRPVSASHTKESAENKLSDSPAKIPSHEASESPYRSPEKVRPKTVRSPLSPLQEPKKKRGGKRRTRRKN